MTISIVANERGLWVAKVCREGRQVFEACHPMRLVAWWLAQRYLDEVAS